MRYLKDIDKDKKSLISIKYEISSRLKVINPLKIILFGSYVYGTPSDESDLDICIIKNNIKSRINEKREIRKLLSGIKIAKDILLVDNNYFLSHSDKNWLNTALYDARHKGEILYEKR